MIEEGLPTVTEDMLCRITENEATLREFIKMVAEVMKKLNVWVEAVDERLGKLEDA